jgi:hypothetical protein
VQVVPGRLVDLELDAVGASASALLVMAVGLTPLAVAFAML